MGIVAERADDYRAGPHAQSQPAARARASGIAW